MSQLPVHLVKELFDYDPLVGVVMWRPRLVRPGERFAWIDTKHNRHYAGRPAGRVAGAGHIYIGITHPRGDGARAYRYPAHWIAWAYCHGEWPRSRLDHKNGKPADNRLANLRLASPLQNAWNASRRRDNSSGYRGVTWANDRNQWRAFIQVNRQKINLGCFDTINQAVAVRRQAELRYFGEYVRQEEQS